MKKSLDSNSFDKSREHLANERTFLAWVRTGIAFIGLGFVVEKFSLFLKQLSFILGVKKTIPTGHASVAGIVMVAIGIVITVLAFIQYIRYKSELNKGTFYASSLLVYLVTSVVIFGGILLIAYFLTII